jgi:transposase InsO family protein
MVMNKNLSFLARLKIKTAPYYSYDSLIIRSTGQDKVWTSDITYIWTKQGWLYLAVFLDVCSRRIVGWSMNRRMTDQLVINAFKKAWYRRRPQPGLIAHSDRGSQYCSSSFKAIEKKWLSS